MLGRFALGGNWSLTALAYSSQWDSTDQIPLRAVDEGVIRRLGTIDPLTAGETSRSIVALRNRDMDGWDAVIYVQRYALNLWSNFTYFLDDPVNGDQFEQADERWIFGGSVAKTWETPLVGWTISTGARSAAMRSTASVFTAPSSACGVSTVREDKVNEWAGAMWAQGERMFGPVRVVLGVAGRRDRRRCFIGQCANSGDASDVLLSPKLALAWRVSEAWSSMPTPAAAFTRTMRAARPRQCRRRPDAADAVHLLAPSTGAELGFRWDAGRSA